MFASLVVAKRIPRTMQKEFFSPFCFKKKKKGKLGESRSSASPGNLEGSTGHFCRALGSVFAFSQHYSEKYRATNCEPLQCRVLLDKASRRKTTSEDLTERCANRNWFAPSIDGFQGWSLWLLWASWFGALIPLLFSESEYSENKVLQQSLALLALIQ